MSKPIIRELPKTGDRDRYILMWHGMIKRFSINPLHTDNVPAELDYHINRMMKNIKREAV